MGSSTDGLTAAQGAPDADPDQLQSGGFLSRLFRKAATPALMAEEASHDMAPSAPKTGPQLGVVNLRRLRVDDVALPKVDIVAVPLSITRDELVEVFREHGLSRIPVYKDTLDQPQGLVTLKDFALTYGFGAQSESFDLGALLRPLLYAPPSMTLTVLLQKMQSERIHMALVIDEYGGVDGLVTIEDLLETVVGDISDEHDTDEGDMWVQEEPGVWVIQAMAALDELEPAIGLRLRTDEEDEEVDTLGGLVYLRAGCVPEQGGIIAHESGAEFEVLDAEPRRIKTLRLRLPKVTES